MQRTFRQCSRRVRVVVIATAATAAITTLTACGSSSSTADGSGGDFKIGVVATLSGAYAYIGQEEVQSATGYFQRINAHGGIDGHKVDIIARDDALSTPTALAAIKQLVTVNKVNALDGMDLDFICTAAAQYVATADVPTMCGLGDIPTFKPVQKYVFSDAGVADNDFDQPMLKLASAKTGIAKPKVAIMSLDAPAPKAWGTSVSAAAKTLGSTVTDAEYAPLTSADIAPYARKIAASSPDVVLANLSDYSSFVPTLRQDGFTGPIIATPNSGQYNTLVALKDANFFQVSVGPPANPSSSTNSAAMKNFIGDLKSQGVKSVSALNASPLRQYYLGDVALGDAMQSCGYPCSGVKLADALEGVTLKLPGLSYGFGFSAKSHVGPRLYGTYSWNAKAKAVSESGQTSPAGSIN